MYYEKCKNIWVVLCVWYLKIIEQHFICLIVIELDLLLPVHLITIENWLQSEIYLQ